MIHHAKGFPTRLCTPGIFIRHPAVKILQQLTYAPWTWSSSHHSNDNQTHSLDKRIYSWIIVMSRPLSKRLVFVASLIWRGQNSLDALMRLSVEPMLCVSCIFTWSNIKYRSPEVKCPSWAFMRLIPSMIIIVNQGWSHHVAVTWSNDGLFEGSIQPEYYLR